MLSVDSVIQIITTVYKSITQATTNRDKCENLENRLSHLSKLLKDNQSCLGQPAFESSLKYLNTVIKKIQTFVNERLSNNALAADNLVGAQSNMRKIDHFETQLNECIAMLNTEIGCQNLTLTRQAIPIQKAVLDSISSITKWFYVFAAGLALMALTAL
jgi:septation ring formation regulator EzrA